MNHLKNGRCLGLMPFLDCVIVKLTYFSIVFRIKFILKITLSETKYINIHFQIHVFSNYFFTKTNI